MKTSLKYFYWAMQGGSAPFDPLSLSPDFWIDATDVDLYESTVAGDNLENDKGRLISTQTTKDANAYTSTPISAGSLRFLPSYNGEGQYFNGQTGNTYRTAADWKFLSDGSQWELFGIIKPLAVADAASPYKLFSTVNTLTANSSIGFHLSVYNRASTNNTNTIKVSIYNSGGGTPGIFEAIGGNNSVPIDQYNITHAYFTGVTLVVRVYNGTSGVWTTLTTTTTGGTPSASNPVTALQVGGAASTRCYFKHLFIKQGNLTADQRTNMEAWCISEMANVIIPTPAKLYFSGPAQSNWYGEGLNTQIAPELAGKLGSRVFYLTGNLDSNKTGFWAECETGVTMNPSVLTQHSFLCRFAYEMAQNGTPCYIINRGVGATYLIPDGVGASWSSITQISGTDLYNYITTLVIPDALEELEHVLRKTPEVRMLIKFQDNNDASDARGITTEALYHDEWEAWIRNFADYLIGRGLDTSKLRVLDLRLKDYASYAKGTDVYNAEVDVDTNFLTDNPTYASKVAGTHGMDTDAYSSVGIHFDAAGFDDMGFDVFDLAVLYVNE